mgnify:CR=1 FL=1
MFQNILVALDLNEPTVELLLYAEEIAKRFDAKLWLVHIAAPDPDFVGYEPGPQYVRDYRAEELRKEHQQLQDLARTFENNVIQAEGLLIEGATTEMIVGECKKLNIDLICMYHHQHPWWQELLGSHTDFHVIEKTKVPVLTVPI